MCMVYSGTRGSQIEKGDVQQWWENVPSIFLISYRNGRSYRERGENSLLFFEMTRTRRVP